MSYIMLNQNKPFRGDFTTENRELSQYIDVSLGSPDIITFKNIVAEFSVISSSVYVLRCNLVSGVVCYMHSTDSLYQVPHEIVYNITAEIEWQSIVVYSLHRLNAGVEVPVSDPVSLTLNLEIKKMSNINGR